MSALPPKADMKARGELATTIAELGWIAGNGGGAYPII
jgi:hypothetical protein